MTLASTLVYSSTSDLRTVLGCCAALTRSATFTPARFSVRLSEKKAIQNEAAKRERRNPATLGRKFRARRCAHPALCTPLAAAWTGASARLVAARMLCTRFLGGSTSGTARKSSIPSSASAKEARQSAQLWRCASKASLTAGDKAVNAAE